MKAKFKLDGLERDLREGRSQAYRRCGRGPCELNPRLLEREAMGPTRCISSTSERVAKLDTHPNERNRAISGCDGCMIWRDFDMR
jgi:hypothetical protein